MHPFRSAPAHCKPYNEVKMHAVCCLQNICVLLLFLQIIYNIFTNYLYNICTTSAQRYKNVLCLFGLH